LLQTSYISGRRMPLKPRAALEAVRALVAGSVDELSAAAELLRALGDIDRLRIVTELLDRPRTLRELASSLGATPFEVRHRLIRFQNTGVVVVEDEPEMRFDIRPDLRPALEQLLAAMHPTLTAVSAAPSRNAQLSEVSG